MQTQDSEQEKEQDSILDNHGVHIEKDDIIDWNDDSKDFPRNWSRWPKLYACILLSWLECYMTLVSSAGAAAAKSAEKEYGVSSELSIFAFLTVYLIGQTLGGIFCSPISEVFGRRTIYIIATAAFALASLIVAGPRSIAGVFVGRFFQGVAAAIPATVVFGNFNDLYDAAVRIWVVYGYTAFGITGLALGPIYGSYITNVLGWRWVFWISAIASGISVAACFFIKESNAEQLLLKKAKQIRKETGNEKLKAQSEEDDDGNAVQDFLTTNIYRPARFVVTEPLVTFCAVLCAIAFGLIYGLTEALTIVYTTPPFDRHFDDVSSSLSFISILIGIIINVLPRFYDVYLLRQCRQNKQYIRPETKIRSFAIACPSLAIGLWLFGWTIPDGVPNAPWAVSMIGLVFVGFAANDFSYVLFGYITDSYGQYAASAVGALSTARTIAAAIFPLFATQMYQGLGNNNATTILAAVATAFCFTPYLFLKYGEKLREKSQWAESGDDILPEENKHMQDKDDQGEA